MFMSYSRKVTSLLTAYYVRMVGLDQHGSSQSNVLADSVIALGVLFLVRA